MGKSYYVYILSNNSRMLYTGMTNDLQQRVYQHKQKQVSGFTKKYNLYKLVYYAETDDVGYAIRREKEIKGWSRKKKKELIESINPEWRDLAKDWYS
ncbi:GIY-YIG nuclease family protein [Gracilimonas sp.]|uniref:GIY-YIG nuclease family protein n=1 Tax=Gracilimonas sp. TaxID=1974203 RepID=UPI0032EBB158